MPINFDHSLQYQFVVFYDDNGQEATELKDLPDILSRQLPNTKSLGLKLSKKERQTTLIQSGASAAPVPTVTWVAGSGIWRLVWTPLRLDLFFDASGFAEITASIRDDAPHEPPTLRDVTARVASNLGEAVSIASRPVNRLALVFTGKSSCTVGPTPAEIVSNRFFNETVRHDVEIGNVRDLTGRVNLGTNWELPIAEQRRQNLRINRIEQGVANWQYEDRVESIFLTWLLDVNTSPASGPETLFAPASVPAFLEQAEQWIGSRLEVLNA